MGIGGWEGRMCQGEPLDRPVRVTVIRPGEGELRGFSPPGTHWLTRMRGTGSLPPPGPGARTLGTSSLRQVGSRTWLLPWPPLGPDHPALLVPPGLRGHLHRAAESHPDHPGIRRQGLHLHLHHGDAAQVGGLWLQGVLHQRLVLARLPHRGCESAPPPAPQSDPRWSLWLRPCSP